MTRSPMPSAYAPGMRCPALGRLAREHLDIAMAWQGGLVPRKERFGLILFAELDRIIRGGECSQRLIELADACRQVLSDPERAGFLAAVVEDARQATAARAAVGRARSFWGVTPIINIIPSAAADRLAGVEAETVVYTSYYITRDFDIILANQYEWISGRHPVGAEFYPWLVLIWALLSFDNFFLFNDRGVLPAGGYGSARFGINLEEMQLLRASGKRLYTMTYGADHRIREKTLASDKFNFCMDCPEPGRYCLCDGDGGQRVLDTIAEHATAMLATGVSVAYVPRCRPLQYFALDLDRIVPHYGEPPIGRPLRIAHSPNHAFFKGTRYLEGAVEQLRQEGHSVELLLTSGVPNARALELLASADIVADQFIGGHFGYTALEAMALGKPVLCYVRNPLLAADPAMLPIINANPDDLYDVLKGIVSNPEGLPEIGRRGRAYVERHHTIAALAMRLAELYRETCPDGARWLAADGPRRSALGKRAAAKVYRRFLWYSGTRADRAALTAKHGVLWYERVRAEALRRLLWWCGTAVDRAALTAKRGVLWNERVRFAVARAFTRSVALVWTTLRRLCAVPLRAAGSTLLVTARLLTAVRLRWGKPRSLWGVTPILTLPILAECDRRLGFASRSLVYSTYYITRNFDFNLEKLLSILSRYAPPFVPMLPKFVLMWALFRYDFFHFFLDRGILSPTDRFGIHPTEAEILYRAGKRLYTYTYGADVRTRATTLALGTYNFCVDCPQPGRFCICDDAIAAQNIALLKPHATAMLAMGDMLAYVPDATELLFWPLDLDRFEPAPPNYRRDRPLRVFHAPNHMHFKGTRHLEAAVARLERQGYAVELVRVQGVPNAEVLRLMRECDVVAEQFIGGFHGYTALEAMALGKPVISYVRSRRLLADARDCPILDADPDRLEGVLRDCVAGRYDLAALGRQGRTYVEKYHSIDAVAVRLGRLYLDTAGLPRRRAARLSVRVGEIEARLRAIVVPRAVDETSRVA